MEKYIHIGKHSAYADGDTLFFHIAGNLTMLEIQEYLRLAEKIELSHGYCFIVDDISDLGAAAPEVRRTVAQWLSSHACRGAALVGGSLTARTIAVLVIGVMKMMGSKLLPIVFMKTEQEARDWISLQRRNALTRNSDQHV